MSMKLSEVTLEELMDAINNRNEAHETKMISMFAEMEDRVSKVESKIDEVDNELKFVLPIMTSIRESFVGMETIVNGVTTKVFDNKGDDAYETEDVYELTGIIDLKASLKKELDEMKETAQLLEAYIKDVPGAVVHGLNQAYDTKKDEDNTDTRSEDDDDDKSEEVSLGDGSHDDLDDDSDEGIDLVYDDIESENEHAETTSKSEKKGGSKKDKNVTIVTPTKEQAHAKKPKKFSFDLNDEFEESLFTDDMIKKINKEIASGSIYVGKDLKSAYKALKDKYKDRYAYTHQTVGRALLFKNQILQVAMVGGQVLAGWICGDTRIKFELLKKKDLDKLKSSAQEMYLQIMNCCKFGHTTKQFERATSKTEYKMQALWQHMTKIEASRTFEAQAIRRQILEKSISIGSFQYQQFNDSVEELCDKLEKCDKRVQLSDFELVELYLRATPHKHSGWQATSSRVTDKVLELRAQHMDEGVILEYVKAQYEQYANRIEPIKKFSNDPGKDGKKEEKVKLEDGSFAILKKLKGQAVRRLVAQDGRDNANKGGKGKVSCFNCGGSHMASQCTVLNPSKKQKEQGEQARKEYEARKKAKAEAKTSVKKAKIEMEEDDDDTDESALIGKRLRISVCRFESSLAEPEETIVLEDKVSGVQGTYDDNEDTDSEADIDIYEDLCRASKMVWSRRVIPAGTQDQGSKSAVRNDIKLPEAVQSQDQGSTDEIRGAAGAYHRSVLTRKY